MTSIAGYELGTLLGQGNFGQTFAASKDGHQVALKLIRADALQQGFDSRRFEREVRALQRATGPNVVRLIESGKAPLGNEDRYYVALELLQGHDLARAFLNVGKAFDERALKRILARVISGLETIHAQNIVHRDLKPANVFLTDTGEVKLLDFGLVKMLDYTTLTTMPGEARGTPQFIAPEILRGDSVDLRADFYSFGVLIYHLVTGGQYPFTAQTPLALYVQVDNNPPMPPTRHNPSLSSQFENLILELLTKQPYERRFTHTELREAIRDTPLFVSTDDEQPQQADRMEYSKTCLFRLLQNERSDVERFAQAGGEMDGIEYPANFLPRMRNSLEAYSALGLRYQFDPVTYRLAYSSFSQTQGLVALPYVPDPESVLTVEDLQTLRQQQTYARSCVDWQLLWGCSPVVAPFHFARDLNSPWIDVDIKLLEEVVSYAESMQDAPLVYAGLCLNIEAYTVASNRLALLNRYSRARADGYLFYVDNVEERTDNPLQLRAMFELLRMFQRLGKPVLACRVGTLGLGLLAAGVDGITNGIASLSSFSESTLLSNRSAGYDMQKKYYVPGLMLTLPVPLAQDILSDPRNSYLRCGCVHCNDSFTNLDNAAKPHFLRARTEEIAELNSMPDTLVRAYWFRQRVEDALQACEAVRRQQEAALRPHHYSHLRTWLQVFGTPQSIN